MRIMPVRNLMMNASDMVIVRVNILLAGSSSLWSDRASTDQDPWEMFRVLLESISIATLSKNQLFGPDGRSCTTQTHILAVWKIDYACTTQ